MRAANWLSPDEPSDKRSYRGIEGEGVRKRGRTLLREADRLAGRMTRSQIFERALAAWVRRRGQAELDQAIERYYRSLSAAERREDESWATLGDEMMRRGWDLSTSAIDSRTT